MGQNRRRKLCKTYLQDILFTQYIALAKLIMHGAALFHLFVANQLEI